MEVKSKKVLSYVVYILCFALGWAAAYAYQAKNMTSQKDRVQQLTSPGANHTAELIRKRNLADINFIVRIDGIEVYRSPDYAPLQDRLYRETLQWDETGQVIFLELLGKRVFAFDASKWLRLRKGDLERYGFYPAKGQYYYYAQIIDIDE